MRELKPYKEKVDLLGREIEPLQQTTEGVLGSAAREGCTFSRYVARLVEAIEP